jgi:ribosomal-protein-alanine N-acetyltransferase
MGSAGMSLPGLQAKRLVLEPFKPGHVDALHGLWTDREVRRYLWDDEVISYERARSTVLASIASAEAEGLGMWALVPQGGSGVIGFAGLRHPADSFEVELLYGLAPAHWRQGLATEAASAVLRYAFDSCGLTRVLAGADAPNERSMAVMRRLGMAPYIPGVPSVPGALYFVVDAQEFATVRRLAEQGAGSADHAG